ncbi:unnamed protein product [Symbiodinium sp. CCMP2592]|nr:unnamed protein product [Symbiodinium sp. CCMP2592]
MTTGSLKQTRKRKKVLIARKRRKKPQPAAVQPLCVSEPVAGTSQKRKLSAKSATARRKGNLELAGSKVVTRRKKILQASGSKKRARKESHSGGKRKKCKAKATASPKDACSQQEQPPGQEASAAQRDKGDEQCEADPSDVPKKCTLGDTEKSKKRKAKSKGAQAPMKSTGGDEAAAGADEQKMATEQKKDSDVKTGPGSHSDDSAQCLKICAANLPWWFDKARIERHFRRMGDVAHVWLLYDKWGESRGVAFITFSDKASVKAALQCDGTSIGGNVVRVNLALDKTKDADAKGKGQSKGWAGGGAWADDASPNQAAGTSAGHSTKGRGRGKGGKGGKGTGSEQSGILALPNRPEGSLGLMARGLSYDATEKDLQQLFSQCGSGPTRVRVLVDKDGWSKGKAFLDFADEAAVEKAMEFNDQLLKGRKLRLEYTRAAS